MLYQTKLIEAFLFYHYLMTVLKYDYMPLLFFYLQTF